MYRNVGANDTLETKGAGIPVLFTSVGPSIESVSSATVTVLNTKGQYKYRSGVYMCK